MLLPRERLVDQMMAARTPEEVRAARANLGEYLDEYPGDPLVMEHAEMFEKMAGAVGAPDPDLVGNPKETV